MKKVITYFILAIVMFCTTSLQAQPECPGDITRYRAFDFYFFGQSFSVVAFNFNGPACGHTSWHFMEGAYLDIYADGNALLHGMATTTGRFCPEYNGEVWEVHIALDSVEYVNPKDPVGDPDLSLWKFFKLDESDAYLRSTLTGEVVTLTQRGPGAQLGQGANDKTDTFGFSTWFYYVRENGYTEAGDVNIDLELICEPTPPPIVCDDLPFRTQTPGGWGAPPRGGNPGSYLHANFDDAFPADVKIGCTYTSTFTTAQAITDFLPSGGTPVALTQNYTNPTPASLKNTLAMHVLALTLTVGFDNNDAGFGQSANSLDDMVASDGTFEGWTVAQILAEGNKVLGGCASSYTPSQMTEVLTLINENYVDGNMTGDFLICPGDDTENENARVAVYPNPVVNDKAVVRFGNAKGAIRYEVFDFYGRLVFSGEARNTKEFEITGLSSIPKGRYIIRINSGKKATAKLFYKN